MPIQLACSSCNARYAVADDKAGKRVRCKCGQELDVPVAATSVDPLLTRRVTSEPSHTRGVAKPAAPAAQLGSMFDELTEADWKRESPIAKAFAPQKKTSEAKALKQFVVPDGKSSDSNKLPGLLLLLSILNFFGAVIHVFAGIAIVALVGVMASLEQAIPFIRVAAAFFSFYFVAWGIYMAVLGVGLLQRSPWGWWVAGVAYAEAIIDKIYYVAHSIIVRDEIPKIIGAVLGFLVMLSITSYIYSQETRARFKIKTKTPVLICSAIGIIIGLLSVGVFVALEKQVEALPEEPEAVQPI